MNKAEDSEVEANFFCALQVSVNTGRCTLCPDWIHRRCFQSSSSLLRWSLLLLMAKDKQKEEIYYAYLCLR